MQAFCEDPAVKEKFMKYCGRHNPTSDNIDRDREKLVDWSKNKPEWWPDSVPFRNPSGTPKMTMVDCNTVIKTFIATLPDDDDSLESREDDYSDAHCQRLLDDIKNLNYAQIYNDLSSEFHIKRPEKNDVCLWVKRVYRKVWSQSMSHVMPRAFIVLFLYCSMVTNDDGSI